MPVDPFYLAWKARQLGVNTEFIELSGRINASMPHYVVMKVMRMLNANHRALNGSRVGLLGVAYKKNSSDVRESPAEKIVELLLEEGAVVTYHDPHVPSFNVEGHQLRSEPSLRRFLTGQDCAVVVADHDAIDWTLVLQYAPMIIDTRNVLGRLSPFAAKPARPEQRLERGV